MASEPTSGTRLEHWELFADEAAAGIAFLDPDRRLLWINRRMRELFDLPPSVPRGQGMLDALPLELARQLDEVVGTALGSGCSTGQITCPATSPSETVHDWVVSANAVSHPDDEVLLGVTLTLRDATQLTQTERTLRAMRAVTESLHEMSDQQESVDELLGAIGRAVGGYVAEYWAPEEPRGDSLSCQGLVCPPDLERSSRLRTLFDDALLSFRRSLVTVAWTERTTRWLDDVSADRGLGRQPPARSLGLRTAFAFPVRSSRRTFGVMAFYARERLPVDARFLQAMGTMGREIGERWARFEAEEALRLADQRKTEFLAVLGHELRNPLATLSTGVQLLRMENAIEPWTQEMMSRNVAMMSRLLDDLLDLNRIEQGTFDVRTAPIDAGDVVERVAKLQRASGNLGKRELRVEVQASGLLVQADALRFEQALTNVVGNALKFTDDEGRITVTARADREWVRIAVTDDGPGIAASDMPRIFEPFTQVGERGLPGLGVGLSLARQIMERHGGEIRAESPGLGHGTTVTLSLPTHRSPPETAPVGGDEAPSDPRVASDLVGRGHVLLVDDDESSVRLLARVLEAWGLETSVAEDGASALARACAVRPDVLLIDVALPDTTGFDLAERLRREAAPDAIYIALSGYGDESVQARAHAAGFHHYLIKPAKHAELRTVLDGILAARGSD